MRAFKHIFKGTLLLLTTAALLAVGSYVALQTEWGNRQVEQILENQLDAKITGLSGSLPFALHATSLTLNDETGPWLTAENVALEWSIDFSPVTWRVHILQAERIHWLRLPQDEGNGDFSLPPLSVESVSLPRVEIEPPVTGHRHMLTVDGGFALDGKPQANFALRTLEGPRTELTIAASGGSISAQWREEQGGVFGALLGLPDQSWRLEAEFQVQDDVYNVKSFHIVMSDDMEAWLAGMVKEPLGAARFDLEGQILRWNSAPEAIARLMENPIPFAVSGAWEEALRIASLRIEGRHATLTASDILLDEALSGKVELSIPDAGYLHAELRGALMATGELSGTLSMPQSQVEASLSDEGRELKARSQVALDGDLLRFSGLYAETRGLTLTGALIYDMETALAEGILNIDAADLSGLNPFLAAEVEGSGEAEVTLAAVSGKQRMEAEGKLKDTAYGDTAAGALNFRFHAADIAALEGVDAEAQVAQLKSSETIIDTLSLTAKGSGKRTQWTFNAESKADPALALQAQGQLEAEIPDWTLKINGLTGTMNANKLSLAVPAVIVHKQTKIILSPLRLNIADGNIQAHGAYSASKVNLRFALSRLPLTLLTDGEYDGRLNGDIHITGTAAKPLAKIDLQATGLASALHEKGGFEFGVTGTLGPDRLALRAQLLKTEGELYADMRLPARFSLEPFELALPPDGALSGALHADAEIGPLLALVLPEGQTLIGHAKGKLDLQGTLAAPWATGALSLTRGNYKNAATGTVLSDMNIRLEAQRDRLELTRGEARAGDGRVIVSGCIGIKPPYVLALHATLDNAEIIDNREASGAANGALELTGDFVSMLLKGSITLGPMEIRLPEGKNVEVPEVKIRNPAVLPKQVWQKEETAKEIMFGPGNMQLEVKVDMPNRVYVRGRGLETEIRGAITAGGTMALPEIEGQLRTVRGRFTLLDRQLAITEGTVTFRSAMPPSPFIRMVAETETQELTAGIRIEGPLRSPELTLTSTPPRPEDEIMAHLLFGRELKSITPFQGIQLAQAIKTLRGKGGGGIDFLGRTRNLLGVDRLDISETDSGDIGVGAGKYISDKIYIGVEGGADPEAGKVKAEIEVSPRFSVETETGGRSSGVRFNWKRDY